MTEEEQLERLKRIMPPIAFGLTGFAFVAVLMAGHETSKALLVAGLMLAFVLTMYVARLLLGVNGFIAVLAAGALLAWRFSGQD